MASIIDKIEQADRLILALVFSLLASSGTALIPTVAFAVAGIWPDGQIYSWHHNEYQFGNIKKSAFDLLTTPACSSAGRLTGISIIRVRKS